jgi:hypothetical protein
VRGKTVKKFIGLPRPRLHLIPFDRSQGRPLPWRAHAHAKLRSEIIPSPPEPATEPACDHAQAQRRPARMTWARLLKRVFDIDIEHCPNRGGALKIIACPEPSSKGRPFDTLRTGIEERR